MKKIFNKNSLLRLKKLLLTKEAILIFAALVVVVVFAIARGGGQAKPLKTQSSGVPSMSENVGTPYSPPPSDISDTPPAELDTPLEPIPPPDILPESDIEPQPPEPGTESEPPPPADDMGEIIDNSEVTPEQPSVNPVTDTPGAMPSDLPSDSPPFTPPDASAQSPETEPDTPIDAPIDAPIDTPPETPDLSSPEMPPNTPQEPIESSVPPQPPIVNFKYIWSGSSFKPCADISWTAETSDFFKWQLCDASGKVLLEGEIPASSGAAARLNNYAFDTSAQSQNGLYPKDYTLKLTPHYSGGTLAPHVMELPYFEVTAQRIDGALRPVISTNIGLYFVHSYENLTDTETGGKLRITGSLLPKEGVQTPLSIDVLSRN